MIKKLLIIIIVVGLAVAIGVFFFGKSSEPVPAPAPSAVPDATIESDSTASINQDLVDLDLGDLNADFKGIDADLNSL